MFVGALVLQLFLKFLILYFDFLSIYSLPFPPLYILFFTFLSPPPCGGCPPTVACAGTSQDGTNAGGIVGDGGAGSKRDVNKGDDTDDRVYTSAEGQEDDGVHTPSRLQSSKYVCVYVCKWPCFNSLL